MPNKLLEISGERTSERIKRWNQSKNNTQFLMCLVQCCKEQCCIGTWNIRFINHGKLEGLKQKARENMDILGISKVKWTWMVEFNSDDCYIYYFGHESLRRNGVAIMVNKRIQNAVPGLQPQKWQNDLGSFPRQVIQHHGNPSLCPLPPMSKKLNLISSLKN